MKAQMMMITVEVGLLIACTCPSPAAMVQIGVPGPGASPGASDAGPPDSFDLAVSAQSSNHSAPARFVPRELVPWFLDDVRAAVVGLAGNAIGITRLDAGAVILRYDYHGGKHWPYEDIYARKPITYLGEVFLIHDEQYEQDVVRRQMSLLESDLSLISNMWSLPLDQQPGPVGHAYRVLATAVFGVKTSVWDWWH